MGCLNSKSVTLAVVIFSWGCLTSGSADVVILKDGTRIDAQTVWEDDGLMRFTLPNYEDIIITYSREIVERVEKGQNERDAAGDSWVPGTVPDAGKRKPLPPNGKNASAVSNQSENFETETSTASVPEPEIDMSEVEAVAGIQFYSARRAFKYQTGPDTQYHSFKEAVDDLAAKFGKDPYWVGQNLGDTNDLGQIYINLSRTKEETETEKDATYNKAGILFYDPRRTYKYWVADDSKHHTLEAAINALAEKYSQTPDWIIDHLGETNDLTEIHRNLGKGISAKSDK